jgi:hypothetical protein
MRRRLLASACAALSATCIPNLGPGDSAITSTRILAVRADPAEAPPGTKVTFTSFVAGTGGALAGSSVVWDFCTAPRPLTDDNVVSNACLATGALVSAGAGPTLTAATPSKGCSLFGPDTPPGGFRPADPDPTGGYYQPLRADLAGAETAFALARIHCDLANADAAAATAFAAAYKPNQNPALDPVTLTIGGAAANLSSVPTGAKVTFTASWPPADAESYAYFDVATQAVTTQHEAMQVAWYSTAGTFATEATGRAASDPAASSTNTWTAPSSPGPAHVFVVLRDDRGGVDFATVDFAVTE